MTRRFLILLFVLLPVYCFCQDKAVAIKNVAVVDVIQNKVTGGRTVIIEGNRIVSVGNKPIPPGATVLDGTGKYLIPGLSDMHTHSLRKGRVSTFFPLFVANGVTGIRDMASDMPLEEIVQLNHDIENSKIVGPHLLSFTGKILDGPPQPDTLLFTYPSGPDSARAIVRSYKQRGASFIKVYNMLSKEMYAAIAEECKRINIPFAGHVPFALTALEASASGQRSIEHLSDLLVSLATNESELRAELTTSKSANAIQSSKKRMDINFVAAENYSLQKASALFSLFVRNDTWQCPTLRNLQITSSHGSLPLLMNDVRLKYFPNTLIEAWKRSLTSRLTGDSIQRARFFNQSLQIVLQMQKAGVKIIAGTDLSSSFQMPGFTLHDELALMVEAGLTPFEALQTATINVAKFLDQEKQRGSVEPGKTADLVLLDGNPLKDIGNVRRVHAVISNGRLLRRSDLDALLKQVEETVQKVNSGQ